jgi:hypothetical protein
MNQTHKITRMLHEWSDGNRAALEELLPLVYTAVWESLNR